MKKLLINISYLLFTITSYNVQANLLSNPGFESDLINWSSTGGASIRTEAPAPHEGKNYIFGKNTELFSVWQDIDLISSGFTADVIDTGNLIVEFGGWQSGFSTQTDSGQISISFFGEAHDEIGKTQLSSFYSNMTWEEQLGVTELLTGTRSIRYEFTGTRDHGSNNDAYLDAAHLHIEAAQQAPVPLPASIWLFGSSLFGFLGLRRSNKNKS